jgi:hypothetical protein
MPTKVGMKADTCHFSDLPNDAAEGLAAEEALGVPRRREYVDSPGL